MVKPKAPFKHLLTANFNAMGTAFHRRGFLHRSYGVSYVHVTHRQFQRKKSFAQGVLLQKRVSQAVVSEQVGCTNSQNNKSCLLFFHFQGPGEKQHSNEKHGRNKEEDESLER